MLVLIINSIFFVTLIVGSIIIHLSFGHGSKYYVKKNRELNNNKFNYISKINLNGKKLIEELKNYYMINYKYLKDYKIVIKNDKRTKNGEIVPLDELEKDGDHLGEVKCFSKIIELNRKFAYDINEDIIQDCFHEIKHAIDEKKLQKSVLMFYIFPIVSTCSSILMICYESIFILAYAISILGATYTSYLRAMDEYRAVTFVPKECEQWVEHNNKFNKDEKLNLLAYLYENADKVKRYYVSYKFLVCNAASLFIMFAVEFISIIKVVVLK